MNVKPAGDPFHQPTNVFFGITLKQWANLPIYVQDAMTGQHRTYLRLLKKYEESAGIKPVEDHMEVYRMQEVAVVETDSGEYVFPFADRGSYNRATVTLHLPTPEGHIKRKITMSYNSSKSEGEVEIYSHSGHGMRIKPRASNTFTLEIAD